MSSQELASHRENAEIYNADESLCKQKSIDLLNEINMPSGLLPLDNLQEVGYNRTTGFVWLRQKKRKEHLFRLIKKNVAYETEITAFVEDRKMKKLTGVKSKELLFWITISDIYIDDRDMNKITFANSSGLSRTFPVSAFQEEDTTTTSKN